MYFLSQGPRDCCSTNPVDCDKRRMSLGATMRLGFGDGFLATEQFRTANKKTLHDAFELGNFLKMTTTSKKSGLGKVVWPQRLCWYNDMFS